MAKDWLKEAGKAFSKIGEGVVDVTTRAVDEARKTAGIGVGEVAIELDRYKLAPGDNVTGTIKLVLNEEIEAERLVVALIGTRRGDGDADETFFELEHELGGADTYSDGTYDLDIQIPDDAIAPTPSSQGFIGDLASIVTSGIEALASGSKRPARWQVVAGLDIPWRRNLKTRVDITIE
jgi:hypothetical protein